MRAWQELIGRLIQWVIHGGVRDFLDKETRSKIAMTHIISWIGLGALIPMGFLAFRDWNPILGSFDLSVAAVLIFTQIYSRLTGKFTFTQYFGITCIGFLFFFLMTSGGVQSTGHVWLFTFPLITFFLLGIRHGAVAGFILLFSILAFWTVQLFIPGGHLYSFAFQIRFTISFLVVFLFAYTFEKIRFRAQEALAKNQAELERKVGDRTQDLKMINESLKMEIREREKAEALLRTSEEKYRLLFENSFDTIYSLDRDLKIVNISPSVERVLGYKPAELLGKNVYELNILPEKSMEAAFSSIMKVFGGETIPSLEYEFIAKDGTTKIGQVSGAPLYRDGEVAGLISIARDITTAKKAEELLRRNEEEAKKLAEENRIMAEIGKLVGSTLQIEEVYERFAQEVRKLIPCDRVGINMKNFGGDTATIIYTAGLEVPGRQAGDVFPLVGTVTEEVLRTRSSLLLSSNDGEILVKRFPGYLPFYQAGLRSMMAILLFSREETIGVLVISAVGENVYREEHLRMAEKVGNQIAGAIANAQLFAERHRAEEELRQAQEILEARVKERTDDLVKARDAAEIASRAKSEFLANMSHELRTPLNHILGFTELVVNKECGDLNPEQEEYLKDVLQSSQHLLALINDILDLSKVEAGKLELETVDLNLHVLLENSLYMIKEKAQKHGIRLVTDFDGILEFMRADERKMKQILYNLLSNAVKFTPDGGGVCLGARWHSENPPNSPWIKGGEGGFIEISVEDTGIGIKREDLQRIFAPFEQVESSTSRRYQGTGLGLSLTRRLVELHGGKIWAESAGEGKGSKFTFILPV